MNIGILTFHNAHNYGAVLQAYALKTYLQKMGHKVKILNYRNNTISKKYADRLSYKYRLKDCFNIHSWLKIRKDFLDTNFAQSDWKQQCEKFELFINEVLLNGDKRVIKSDDFEKLEIDVFVAGSDQIWNKYITGDFDSAYFLQFNTNAKKVFYAASNGFNCVRDDEKKYYLNALKDVDVISTREASLALSLQELLNRDVFHVVDPTLLLDSKDYLILLNNKTKIENRFIFAYFISEDNFMMKIVQYLSRVLNLPVIELHYYKCRNLAGHNQRADLGPLEFLQYMRDADFVITNSFHGTVFSMIFEKTFYSVYGEDTRKNELLASVNLENRHIKKISDIDLNDRIDYIKVKSKMIENRKESEEFIIDNFPI